MMVFLQPRYLIFLLPLGVSIFLLTLSLLFSGGDSDNDGTDGSDGGDDGGDGESGDADLDGGDANGDSDTSGDDTDGDQTKSHGANHKSTAPRSLLINGFALAWGVFGIGANQLLFPDAQEPAFSKLWPVFLIALVAGLAGALVMRQFAQRLMPGVKTQTVSRDALFGLTGTLLFAATVTGGRVRVYDEFNTFHDEPCRVAVGAASIAKRAKVRIVDRDAVSGRLIVEAVH